MSQTQTQTQGQTITPICNLDKIQEIITREGLNLLVVSYGGCCSNTLVDLLDNNDYKCKTRIWHDILCHCPTYIECDIPIIYLYDNPIKSFISMKNRGTGFWDVNQQKMSNNKNVILTDENLLQLMIKQFTSWTSEKRKNVLIVNSSELFEDTIVNKLEGFLNKKLLFFPLHYVPPKTNTQSISNMNKELLQLFEKYQDDIDKITNFKT
jgi:hypothetical protein